MEYIFGGVLSQLDPKVLYVVVGILMLSVILSILKRAVKMAIIIGVMALAVGSLGPMAQQIQENYAFDVRDGVANITVHGQVVELDREKIKEVKLINKGTSGYSLKVQYDDAITEVKVPTFMVSEIKQYAGKYDIPFILEE